MKKLISFFLIFVLLFAAAACARSSTAVDNTRGSLTVAYDVDLTEDLLAYFRANQACKAEGVLLDEETDYAALSQKAFVALVKDEAVAEKLKAAGWIETEDWSESQKKANEEMFGFIVLTTPERTAEQKVASKLLTDWLVGDGVYERTITTTSGSCGCSRNETTVTIMSDAPDLCRDARFAKLVNP